MQVLLAVKCEVFCYELTITSVGFVILKVNIW